MPIIGHGDIASVLKDRNDRIYFASGVSDSSEDRESEFIREKLLLMGQDNYRHLVYFSSLSIFYNPDSRYAKHKLDMEDMVKHLFLKYTIIRLGNITWGTNPKTLLNYLKNRAIRGLSLDVRDVYRYVIDKDEFLHWMDMIPNWNCEMNLPGKMMKVKDILNAYGILEDQSKEVQSGLGVSYPHFNKDLGYVGRSRLGTGSGFVFHPPTSLVVP